MGSNRAYRAYLGSPASGQFFHRKDVMMGKVYERVTTFRCLGVIYQQGLSFGVAGKRLIESDETNLFVPGMINICLATEIFLKSINATQTYLEDETIVNGQTVYVGQEDTMKISPGGQGHALSKLFSGLPDDAKEEIAARVADSGWSGDVFEGLRQYDDVFVEWRYIYEKNDPRVLGTSPLFEIFNAINSYCESHVSDPAKGVANLVDEAAWKEDQKASRKKARR